MKLDDFLQQLQQAPETITFANTMDTIAANYHYTASAFKNGAAINASGSNEGSCKLFYFAKIKQLTPVQTLACFGDYYRIDVLQNPEANDHANIRNFMVTGWNGVSFEGEVLTTR
ncbi:MAG: HopJ type III effector protein [Marinagarivorans sp.]|nr:HopJ type III effector protein [Marinagarivorans sp.]